MIPSCTTAAATLLLATFAVTAWARDIPPGFVDVAQQVEGLVVDMRYAGSNNFVGRSIDGYQGLRCLLTAQAAAALAAVQRDLKPRGFGLKVFDCYRPTRAVAHFRRWARDAADTARKAEFYPQLDKRDLFNLGYLAARSGHSRGSTVDLTLVRLTNGQELDMGTPFDLFSPRSGAGAAGLGREQRENRVLLSAAMARRGFRPYGKEWWHFTLRNEPFPASYFDFVVQGTAATIVAAPAQNFRHSSWKDRIVSHAPSEVVKSLAPAGKLRAALNLGNMVLVQGSADAPRGITPDLARELGRRLGVPVELVPFTGAGKVFEALKTGVWDVAFLAIEPVRAAEIDFTAPYVIIEGVYMVPKDSALKTVADVDRAGVRIGVNQASAYDLNLTRTLKHATLVRGPDGFALFVKDKLEAAAGVKQPLAIYAKTNPGVRIIDGRFMEIRQAMGTPKGRDAGARYLRAFVEEMKASGFVADALKRSNQPDAVVAPPAGN